MLWFLGIVVLLIAIYYFFDIFLHRHPLNGGEILTLAEKRRRDEAFREFDYSITEFPADIVEKKMMNGSGEFKMCQWDYYFAPSQIAGLLKYKKHEWIVMAFVKDKTVVYLWWNKGLNRESVSLQLNSRLFAEWVDRNKPDTIMLLHNHPNPNPGRYRVNKPSPTDLLSAGLFHRIFDTLGISLLEFICERGKPYLYYAAFHPSFIPVHPLIKEIEAINGLSIFRNYKLRKEMKRRSLADLIPGAVLSSLTNE